MEVVEEANRAAVESCQKLVAFLSLSTGDGFRPMPVAAETDEVVARFSKVVAVLSDRLGHARARIGKRSPALPVGVDASCLLDRPSSLAPGHTPNGGHVVSSTPAPPPSAATTAATMRSVAPMRSQETEVAPAVLLSPCASVAPAAAKKFDTNMFLETPLLELNSCGVLPSPAMAAAQKNTSTVVTAPSPNPCTTIAAHIQFQPQQQQQQQAKKQKSFQFDQTPRGEQFHIEVPVPLPRGGGGGGAAKEVISFSFDNNSVCTSSAATSFFTSISSQLISMSDAATSSAATAKKACAKRGEDGSVKCHCPKKK